jgi:hypothetical protein
MKPWRVELRAIAAVLAAWLTMPVQAVAQDTETPAAVPQVTPNSLIGQSGAEAGQAAPAPADAGAVAITNRPVEVRAGPSASATVLYGFPAGRPFRLIGREAGFARIQDLNSIATGWIDETALGRPAPVEATSVRSAPQPAPYNENAATASAGQGEVQPSPEQNLIRKSRRTGSGQGPISGFLGRLFSNR